jgi:hypothetical protein
MHPGCIQGAPQPNLCLVIRLLDACVVAEDFVLLGVVCCSLQPKCWWEVEPLDSPMQQQQQQQQVPGASDSQHVVKLMANRVSIMNPRCLFLRAVYFWVLRGADLVLAETPSIGVHNKSVLHRDDCLIGPSTSLIASWCGIQGPVLWM